jgi:hypothetical protein
MAPLCYRPITRKSVHLCTAAKFHGRESMSCLRCYWRALSRSIPNRRMRRFRGFPRVERRSHFGVVRPDRRRALSRNVAWGKRRNAARYSLTFQMYKKLPSLAVSTRRAAFRVARFSAERTFSFDSANGTFSAEAAFRLSRSLKIVTTIGLCFPFRPCGTSDCTMVLR